MATFTSDAPSTRQKAWRAQFSPHAATGDAAVEVRQRSHNHQRAANVLAEPPDQRKPNVCARARSRWPSVSALYGVGRHGRTSPG